MKKRLYIVVEGQSEEEFVNSLLGKYFLRHEIYVCPVIIRTSKGHRGGFSNYRHLKNDIQRLLKSQGDDVVVTTFVDFFRCPELPGKELWNNVMDHAERVEKMELAMKDDIQDSRFHPYIQLHEFEALLFSSGEGFRKYFDERTSSKVQSVIDAFDNPEEINSSPEKAPSKRLLHIIPEYDKVLYGNIIALEIGLDKILARCPRFRRWIETLLRLCA